ncbi:hypothetical protein ACW7N6_38090 [Streptomyces sp. UC1A3]
MKHSARIRAEVQALPPLQAERRLRNRLNGDLTNTLDDLLATGSAGTEEALRERLDEYSEMLLDRLLESPTARPVEGGDDR